MCLLLCKGSTIALHIMCMTGCGDMRQERTLRCMPCSAWSRQQPARRLLSQLRDRPRF